MIENPQTTRSQISLPRKLEPLFRPMRYKVLWGGRGAIKSWSIARALLYLASKSQELILCARETQASISDSVHRLLKEQIELLNSLHSTVFIHTGFTHECGRHIETVAGSPIQSVLCAATCRRTEVDSLVRGLTKTHGPRENCAPFMFSTRLVPRMCSCVTLVG